MTNNENDLAYLSGDSPSETEGSDKESDDDLLRIQRKRPLSEESESDSEVIDRRSKRPVDNGMRKRGQEAADSVDEGSADSSESQRRGSDVSGDEEERGLGTSFDATNIDIDKVKARIADREKFWSESTPSPINTSRSYDKLIQLVGILNTHETSRRAMERFLGRTTPQPKATFKSSIRANRGKQESSNKSEPTAQKDIHSFNRITELTDFLAGPGSMADVLDVSKEALTERLNRIPFEYRVRNEAGQYVFHGPVRYTHFQALIGSAALEFRRAGSSDAWLAINSETS